MSWRSLTIGDQRSAQVAVDESGQLDPAQPWATVKLSSGRTLQVPTEQIETDKSGEYRLSYSLEELGLEKPLSIKSTVLPVIEEKLEVGKRLVTQGEVTVKTHTESQVHLIQEALTKETVSVERVAVNREVAGPLPVREEGNVTIIPLVEEVLVVQRRYVLKEEVRIVRETEENEVEHEVTVRNQSATISRLDESEIEK